MRGKEASGPFPETIFNFSSLQLPAFAKIPASAAPRSAIRLRESPARGNHSLLAEHEGAWESYPLARAAWRDFQQRCVDISSASCSFTVSNVFFFRFDGYLQGETLLPPNAEKPGSIVVPSTRF